MRVTITVDWRTVPLKSIQECILEEQELFALQKVYPG